MDFYDSSEEEYSSNNELSCVESDDENIMTGGSNSYEINKILENKFSLEDLKKIFKEIIFFEKDKKKYHFIADKKDLNFYNFFTKNEKNISDEETSKTYYESAKSSVTSRIFGRNNKTNQSDDDLKNIKKFKMLLLDHIKYIIFQRKIKDSIQISKKIMNNEPYTTHKTIKFSKKFEEEYIDKLEEN